MSCTTFKFNFSRILVVNWYRGMVLFPARSHVFLERATNVRITIVVLLGLLIKNDDAFSMIAFWKFIFQTEF